MIKSVDIQAEEQNNATTTSEICCWGCDSEGQLGLDNYSYDMSYNKPRFIRYQINVTNLFCGYEHSIVHSEMGNVYAMGSNKFGQIGLGPTVKKRGNPTLLPFCKTNKAWNIGVGGYHTVIFTSNKEIYSFGKNKSGQLGTGDRVNKFFPTKIKISKQDEESDELQLVNIGGGEEFSAVVDVDGNVFSWGSNKFGQLGLNSMELNELVPSQIPSSFFSKDQRHSKIQRVACGQNHMLCLSRDGDVFAIGKNSDNQLGVSGQASSQEKIRSPQKLQLGFKVDELYASNFSAALVEGELYIWGQTPLGFFEKPELVKSQRNVQKVGLMHDGIILQNSYGGFYSVGQNEKGQLGLGDLKPRQELCPIEVLAGKEIKSIAAGKSYCILLTDLIQEMINISKAFSENRPNAPVDEQVHVPNTDESQQTPEQEEVQEDEAGETESEPGIDEFTLKRLISFFELTRRDYINLFQKLIFKQPDLLGKINTKMLQIIMAKEFKIEELLKKIDDDLNGVGLEEYFLDSYAFTKRVKVEEDNKSNHHMISREFRLTKSLSGLLVAADRYSAMALRSEELENMRTKMSAPRGAVGFGQIEIDESNLLSLMKDVEESSSLIEEKIEVISQFLDNQLDNLHLYTT